MPWHLSHRISFHLALSCMVALLACHDDTAEAPAGADDVATDTAEGDADMAADPAAEGGADLAADGTDEPACETDLRPIVFAHGFLGGGDQFALHSMRFVNNGHCLDRIVAFDWNTLDRSTDPVAALDALIDEVLAATGADRVNLAGHSAGGGLAYDYLGDADRAAKVAAYAHIASFLADGPAGPEGEVPTLNLWSDGDLIIDEKGDIEGATNVMLPGVDHFSLVTVADGFEAIYRHFYGEAPTTTEVVRDGPILVSGRALSFGENERAADATVQVYALDGSTGRRLEGEPTAEFDVDENGDWGPLEAEPGAYYEFRVMRAEEGARPVHYYREPFPASNDLVYLRTLPTGGSAAAFLLGAVPFEDDHAVLVNFNANVPILAGRDSLTVNGTEVATEEVASAGQTTIALFFYDDDEDQASDWEPISVFSAFPFIAGLDAFFPADADATIEVVYNGRTLRARAWPSDSEGAVITVFD